MCVDLQIFIKFMNSLDDLQDVYARLLYEDVWIPESLTYKNDVDAEYIDKLDGMHGRRVQNTHVLLIVILPIVIKMKCGPCCPAQ